MSAPRVSVVMPIRNEEAFIERSLGAVLRQDFPPDEMEILVVDGLSDDRTLEIISRFPQAERVRVIANPRKTQATGMNAGIIQARGDIVVRVDGHIIIAPDYVRECVNALESTGAQSVGGRLDAVGLTYLGKAIAAAQRSPFSIPSAYRVSTIDQYTDDVCLGAWPRRVFAQVGLFDETFGANEDYELNYRIRQGGGKIYLCQAIRSTYFGRQTISGVARQFFFYGRSKPHTLLKHPRSLRLRQLIAPAFVGACVVFPLAVALSLWSAYAPFLWLQFLLAAVLACYIFVNLFFSARAAQAGLPLFAALPLIFTLMHLAWGSGFWTGFFSGGAKRHASRTEGVWPDDRSSDTSRSERLPGQSSHFV